MKKIILFLACVFFAIEMNALVPQADFGELGLKYLPSLEEYQAKYTGKIVAYYPAVPYLSNALTKEDEFFTKIGGQLGHKYTISKITGDDSKMTFLLVSISSNKKVKMTINKKASSKNWGWDSNHNYKMDANNAFLITEKGTVPLILMDDYEKIVNDLVGTQLPKEGDPIYKLEKIEIAKAAKPMSSYQESHSYPVFAATFTKIANGEKIVYRTQDIDNIKYFGQYIGKEYPIGSDSPVLRISDMKLVESTYRDSYKYNPADLDIDSYSESNYSRKKVELEYVVKNLQTGKENNYGGNLFRSFTTNASQYMGKKIPEIPRADYYYEVVDVAPSSLTLQNAKTGSRRNYTTTSIKSLANVFDHLGEIVQDPTGYYKALYTICEVYDTLPYSYAKEKEIHFVAINSINGQKKTVKYSNYKTSVFYGDNSGHFDAVLTKVEKPSNSAVRYGKKTTISNNEDGIARYSYVDNIIDILIFTTSKQFNFTLKNVSDNTIKVVWDEAVFVDVDGSTSKVMHSGVKYSERENSQPVSTIIKGANLDDVATPTNRVYFSNDWYTKSLFINANKDAKDQKIKLMLPIQVKDVINEYIFEFTISYEYDHPELINLQ